MAARIQRQLDFSVRKRASVVSTPRTGKAGAQGKADKDAAVPSGSPPCTRNSGEDKNRAWLARNQTKSARDHTRPVEHQTTSAGSCTKQAEDRTVSHGPLASPVKRNLEKNTSPDQQQENQGCPLSPRRERSLQTPPLSPIKLVHNQPGVTGAVGLLASPCKRALSMAPKDPLRSPEKRPLLEAKPLVLKTRFFSSKAKSDSVTVTSAVTRVTSCGDVTPRTSPPATPLASPPATPLKSPNKRASSRASSREAVLREDLPALDAVAHSPRKISRSGLAMDDRHRSAASTPTRQCASLMENTPRRTPCQREQPEPLSPRRSPRKLLTPRRGERGAGSSQSPRKPVRRLDLTPDVAPRGTPRKALVSGSKSSGGGDNGGEMDRLSAPAGTEAETAEHKPPSSSSRRAKLTLIRQRGNAYQAVKQSLHTAKPSRLIGRDAEVKAIREFLEGRIKTVSAGSMYISGAPGTGKTAALMHILDSLQEEHSCRLCYLNCMALQDSVSVFSKLYESLAGSTRVPKNDVQRKLEKFITTSRQPIVVVLDEVDQLDSRQQEVLYTLFEWPSLPNSALILIGVANALDLTDRVLPRLQARSKCRPQLLNFAPYTRLQIAQILQDRLGQGTTADQNIMEPSAVQFCARKISAIAGDARKALDVCRRAVERVESEFSCQASSVASGSPQKKMPGKLVTVGDVSQVLSEVYGTSVEAARHSDSSVPLQQKLLVCTLLILLRQSRCKFVTLGQLHDAYCKICRRRRVSTVDQSEFVNLSTLLESAGIVSLKKAKEPRLTKLTLKLDEGELCNTLQDRVLVSSILAEGLPK